LNNIYFAFVTILLIIAIYLMIIDSYFSSLAFFSLGVLYVIMGWREKASQPKNALIYFILGLFIASVTYLGDFISGNILLSTLEMYESN
tara:strand:+ start:1781 stop:2047 length:267 start_codon:yes stop_codon:yes gene_type:complete